MWRVESLCHICKLPLRPSVEKLQFLEFLNSCKPNFNIKYLPKIDIPLNATSKELPADMIKKSQINQTQQRKKTW